MMEREMIERARLYIDKMANGIDPLTDQPVPDNDLINQVRITRCLFFVSKVLGELLEKGMPSPTQAANATNAPRNRSKKLPFSLPFTARDSFPYSETPVPVSSVIECINALRLDDTIAKLRNASVTRWLLEVGLLEEISLPNGKTAKRPTKAGYEQGLSLEERSGIYGTYTVTLYDEQAQRFILDNIDAIAALQNTRPARQM